MSLQLTSRAVFPVDGLMGYQGYFFVIGVTCSVLGLRDLHPGLSLPLGQWGLKMIQSHNSISNHMCYLFHALESVKNMKTKKLIT